MAIAITTNSLGSGYTVLRKTGSGGDTSTLVSLATAGETVSAAYVSELVWNLASGTLTVARGANTVFEGGISGHVSFQENQMRLEIGGDPQADVIVTTAATGTVLVKLHKQSGEF